MESESNMVNLHKLKLGAEKLEALMAAIDAVDEATLAIENAKDGIDALAGSVTNINTVADNITGINGIATNLTEILLADDNATTATIQAGIATTKASEAVISADEAEGSAIIATTQAGIATTQANLAISAYDAFDDRYLGSKATDPSVDNDGSALLTGAMYFNSSISKMRVYNGTAWMDAGSSINGIVNNQVFTATAGQTVFSFTYDIGSLSVYLNGVKLTSADFTATNGTSFTLGVACVVGDVVEAMAFGTFAVADHYTKSETDNLFVGISGDETIAGVKTFSSSPIVPTPTTATQVANKGYVDALPLSGTIQGIKVGNTAVADATTLDWYEEGTFTPTVQGTAVAGVGTYVRQLGRYTRIGRQVFIEIELEWTAHTGTVGLNIVGLPFSALSASGANTAYIVGLTLPSTTALPSFVLQGSAIFCRVTTDAGTISNIAMDTSVSNLNLTATYKV